MDENIILRFKEFLNDKGISPSELAEKISVQRSSISHILSGRNKPSLDFVVKLLEQYPDLNIYWLLNNKGEKYRDKTKSSALPSSTSSVPDVRENDQRRTDVLNKEGSDKEIRYITIFYTDGSFENYTPGG